MTINVSAMSTAQLNQLKLDLENGNTTANQAELKMVLEELQLRGTEGDVVMVSTATNAKATQSTDKTNKTDEVEETQDAPYDQEAVAATQADIDADMEILKGYEDKYNALIAEQTDLEQQCKDFDYGNLEAVGSSAQASAILKKVEGQITRIKTLIKTTENAIRVLEEQKAVAENQLAKREAEQSQLEEEMEQLHEQIESNEEAAKREVELYEKGADEWIERYIKEFEKSGAKKDDKTMREWVTQKMQMNYKMSPKVQMLYDENDSLIGELNTKAEQLKLVSGAIDTLNAKIEDIDKNLETQNGKLTEYNKNLDVAEKYKVGVIQTRDAWKRVEKARKKKGRGIGSLIKKLVNACKKVVKTVVKGVKKLIQGITGAISGVLKFAGKFTGDILKPLGLEGVCEGVGNALGAAYDFVGATATFDKKEMKQSLKDLENGAEMAVESKIFKQIEKYGKKAGEGIADVAEGAWDIYSGYIQTVAEVTGDIIRESTKGVGGVIDKYMGLDSLGNGVKAMGEFQDGWLNMEAGIMTADKDLVKDGFDQAKDNALEAGLTAARVVGAVLSAGASEAVVDVALEAGADLLIEEAISETAKSVGKDIGGTVGEMVGGVVGAAMGSGYDSLKGANFDLGAVADKAVTAEGVGNFVAEVGKGSLKNAVVVGGKKVAEEAGVDEDIAGFIGSGVGMLYGNATDGTKLDADRQHFQGNSLGAGLAGIADAVGLTDAWNNADKLTDKIADSAGAVGGVVADGAVATGQALGNAAIATGKVVAGAGGAVVGGLSYVGGAIADGAGYVGGLISDGASYVGDILSPVGDAIADGAGYVGGLISDGASYVGDALSPVGDAIADGASATWDGAKWIGGQIADGAGYVGGLVSDGASYVGDALSPVGDAIADGAEATWDGAKWIGGQIADGAEAAWDGIKWTGEQIADGATYVADKTVDGINYVGDAVLKGDNSESWFTKGANALGGAIDSGSQAIGEVVAPVLKAGSDAVSDGYNFLTKDDVIPDDVIIES